MVRALRSQLTGTRLMSTRWLEMSLLGRFSKLWVHQGNWLRWQRTSDRLLCITRWNSKLASADKRMCKLAHWGRLVPQKEKRLDLKGTCLTLAGEPQTNDPKETRGRDVYECGYT